MTAISCVGLDPNRAGRVHDERREIVMPGQVHRAREQAALRMARLSPFAADRAVFERQAAQHRLKAEAEETGARSDRRTLI